MHVHIEDQCFWTEIFHLKSTLSPSLYPTCITCNASNHGYIFAFSIILRFHMEASATILPAGFQTSIPHINISYFGCSWGTSPYGCVKITIFFKQVYLMVWSTSICPLTWPQCYLQFYKGFLSSASKLQLFSSSPDRLWAARSKASPKPMVLTCKCSPALSEIRNLKNSYLIISMKKFPCGYSIRRSLCFDLGTSDPRICSCLSGPIHMLNLQTAKLRKRQHVQ